MSASCWSSFCPKLPRLAFPQAVKLARALVAAADIAPRLPPLSRLSLELLSRRLVVLGRQEGAALPRRNAPETEIERSERRLSLAWAAFFSWLTGIAGLESRHPRARDASALLAQLFPEEERLVRPPPLLAWAESEARLSAIDREGFVVPLCAAGGAPFLEVITEAQSAFGQALEGHEGGAFSSRQQNAVIDAFARSLNAYLSAVAAELLNGDPESTALASMLFAPLAFAAEDTEPPEPVPSTLPLPWEPFDAAWDKAAAAA